jgi:hypothetical protein
MFTRSLSKILPLLKIGWEILNNYRLWLKRKPSVLVVIACGSKIPFHKKITSLHPSMLPKLSINIFTPPN